MICPCLDSTSSTSNTPSLQSYTHIPADPVKNTLLPSSKTNLNTSFCSLLSLAMDVVLSVPQVVLNETRGVKKEFILGCFAALTSSKLSPDLRFLVFVAAAFSGCFAFVAMDFRRKCVRKKKDDATRQQHVIDSSREMIFGRQFAQLQRVQLEDNLKRHPSLSSIVELILSALGLTLPVCTRIIRVAHLGYPIRPRYCYASILNFFRNVQIVLRGTF
jgi:hypothetical protein